MKEKWLTKKFPLMLYCVLAVRFLETNEPECWLPTEFQVLFKWLAMTECHVQLVHNALNEIRTFSLMITITRHYPIEPLSHWHSWTAWSLIHMLKVSIDKHTLSRKLQAHISQENLGLF